MRLNVKNKVLIVTTSEKVNPQITGFIKTRYGLNTNIQSVSVTRKDVKNMIMKGKSFGAVFTIGGELSQKMMKKVMQSGATITEILIDPITKKPRYERVHGVTA